MKSHLPRCRDTYGQTFLGWARVADADVLVSGDDALPVPAGRFAVPIAGPAAFRSMIGEP